MESSPACARATRARRALFDRPVGRRARSCTPTDRDREKEKYNLSGGWLGSQGAGAQVGRTLDDDGRATRPMIALPRRRRAQRRIRGGQIDRRPAQHPLPITYDTSRAVRTREKV